MAKQAANSGQKNLKPIRDKETAKRLGSIGGIESGKAKRIKKLLQLSGEGVKLERMEKEFFDGLDILLFGIDGIKVERQYSVKMKRIDGFIPKLNIAIEHDEKEHEYHEQHDKDREDYINKNYPAKITWIRVKRFMEFEGYGRIIKAVFDGLEKR